jgi:hypothetical protein
MKKEFGYVTDREGNAVAGAEVYIRKQSDNTLVTTYSDNGVTTTSNPLTTDNDGEWSAYFADNVVKIQTYVDGVQQQEVNQHQHFDLSGLADPGGDRIAFWDDSAGQITYLALDTGLSITGTTLSLDGDISTIGALVDPNADRILFWDDSASSYAYLAPSTGLAISGTNFTVDAATTAQILANTADKVLLTDDTWAAADYVALTDAATVDVDLSLGINFSLTIGGNRTLGAPSNTKNGQAGEIIITQDGTGSRTLAYHANWKFAGGSDPVLSTAAGAVDVLSYKVVNSTFIIAALSKAFA